MRGAVSWVISAVGKAATLALSDYVAVADGMIVATNGVLTAGAPFPHAGSFVVPGGDFHRLLNRLEGKTALVHKGGTVAIRAGRFSGSLAALPIDDWLHDRGCDAAWRNTPAGLIEGFRAIRGFVGDGAGWESTVKLDGDAMLATNRTSIVEYACKGVGCGSLPAALVDFVLEKDDAPTKWALDANMVAFQWASGAWIKSLLRADGLPESASKLIGDTAFEDIPALTDDARSALDAAVSFGSDVGVFTDRVEAALGGGVFAVKETFSMSEGLQGTRWSAKPLSAVLAVATHWSPAATRAPFVGAGIRGIIMGRPAL